MSSNNELSNGKVDVSLELALVRGLACTNQSEIHFQVIVNTRFHPHQFEMFFFLSFFFSFIAEIESVQIKQAERNILISQVSIFNKNPTKIIASAVGSVKYINISRGDKRQNKGGIWLCHYTMKQLFAKRCWNSSYEDRCGLTILDLNHVDTNMSQVKLNI